MCLLGRMYIAQQWKYQHQMSVSVCMMSGFQLSLSRVLYICVGFWLLAHESRDFSCWDKNYCYYKLSKLTFFTQNGQVWNKSSCWVKIAVILWICSGFCLSLRKITWFMSQQLKTNTDVERLALVDGLPALSFDSCSTCHSIETTT